MPFIVDLDRGATLSLNPKGVEFWMVDENAEILFFVGHLIFEELGGHELSPQANLLDRFGVFRPEIERAAQRRIAAGSLNNPPVSIRKIDL